MMEGTFRRLMMRAGGSQLSDAAAFLASYGPFGMAMDFTDASIAINDEANTLDYSSVGTIQDGTGLPLGPGSKLTYSAPSLKFTEQADGYIAGQAHNLCLASENVGAAQWNTNNQTTAPDAETVLANAGTNIQPWRQQNVTVVAGATYTLTFEAKAGTHSFMQCSSSNSWGISYQNVNLSTNAFGTGNIANVTLSTPESVGDGWYRYSITAPVPSDSSFNVRLSLQGTATDTRLAAWSPVGTETIKLRKVHLRRTPSVSTYVATTSAAVYDLPYVYSAGVKTGIFPEPAATNLCLRSNDFTNASWTKSNVTTALTATGPDGVANSASTLTATAGNATALQAITSGSSSRLTHCYIKRRTGTGNIDLTQDNGTTWTTVTVTSAWTRVEIASVTSTNPTVGIRIVTSGDAVDVAYFQHETGTVATSPIITYGAAVTRAADNSLKVAVANFPVGGTAHTLYMELQRPEKDVTATFMTLQGTSTDFIQLIDDSASLRGVVRTVADGVTATLALATENALNTPFKIAISADTTADGVHNGGSVVPDAACICATTFATLDIGHASLTRPMLVKAIAYLPARKSGAELQGMTTP